MVRFTYETPIRASDSRRRYIINQIADTVTIIGDTAKTFNARLWDAIDTFQLEGYAVEVQYGFSIAYTAKYSALVIARVA